MVSIYLSGTGNTKYCIELLTSLIDQSARAIPLECCEDVIDAIQCNDTIVLGYPTQFSNAPYMVREFISKNSALWQGKNILCVATMGAFSGDRAGCTARLLKKYGANILGGLHIKMPDDFHRIQKDVELNENQSFSGVVSMKSSSGSVIAMVVLLVFFIIGSGYLLIYNVLYISISKDTRFYGLMKTLGTTQAQIKSLVKNQAVKFACIGIPIGIVLATAVSFGIVPLVLNEGFEQGKSIMDAEVFFHPSIYILSLLFSAVTVWIACNAPAKAAAKISPVEALKFQNFAPKKTKSRNSTNGGKLHIMAFHNVFRDKKRAILVFMSLFMGITMILGTNGVIKSMTAENFIKEYMDYHFEYNDIQFEQAEQPNKEVPQFDEHFVEQIQQVNGVECDFQPLKQKIRKQHILL